MRALVPRAVTPWLAVVTLTAAGAAAAAGYGLTAPKRYEATAQLLVTPVPGADSTYTGLDLLRRGGKRTAAASAAALLRSPQVADAVRAQLGLARSRDSLLSSLDPHVVDESDVVGITVHDASAAGAAQLANAFAEALVSQRTASFQSQLTATIRRDEALLRTAKGAGAQELERRLAVLQSLQGQPDPTLRSAGQASAPESAAWPKLPRLIGIGAGIGVAAGAVLLLLLAAARFLAAAPFPATRFTRGQSTTGGPEYDRRMPERAVDALEARLLEKVEALVTERERLAAREAALATREREVTAKLKELRAAAEAVPAKPVPAKPVPAAAADDLRRREGELEARVTGLAKREQELARRAASVAARERELDARPDPAPDGDLVRREAELAERVSALTRRELELARTASSVAARERELEVRQAPQPVPHAAPRTTAPEEPDPEPVPRPVATATASGAANGTRGRWNLVSLERLVDERGAEFPDRLEEWASYLYFLREYADVNGAVPAGFDALIDDTFSELV
jgi:hypothetical protein